MTSKDAYDISLRYTRLNISNIYIFLIFALLFAGWTVLSADVNETDAYADIRKVMACGYTLLSVTLLLITLKLMVRGNRALALAASLFPSDPETEKASPVRLFRPMSTLLALFPMTAIIIVVNYIILIYAVDGGLF